VSLKSDSAREGNGDELDDELDDEELDEELEDELNDELEDGTTYLDIGDVRRDCGVDNIGGIDG